MLLVEDSPADVYLVKEILESEGLRFQLVVASDGEAAIHMLDRLDEGSEPDAPTLLLLDLNVPRKSGTQVLERLRRSPRCGRIPVVMMSSSDSPADRQRAIDMGATEYFCKPSTLKEFMQLGKIIRRLHEASRKAA
jgi:CheY-like chemotaxis protein